MSRDKHQGWFSALEPDCRMLPIRNVIAESLMEPYAIFTNGEAYTNVLAIVERVEERIRGVHRLTFVIPSLDQDDIVNLLEAFFFVSQREMFKKEGEACLRHVFLAIKHLLEAVDTIHVLMSVQMQSGGVGRSLAQVGS